MAELTAQLDPLPTPGAAPAPADLYVFPTTVGQRRFWTLDSFQPGNSALNMALAAKLTGHVDRAALQAALDQILIRHEILRTSYHLEAGEVTQVVHPPQPVAIRWIDARATPAADTEKRTESLMLEEGAIPFDISKGSFLRAAVATFSDTSHVLMLSLHHIACDGWSNGIVIDELAGNYTRFLQNTPPQPELPLQYADYAVWQADWLKTPEGDAQRDYWRRQIPAEIPVLNLPTDRPRGKKATTSGTIETLLLPLELSERMRELCQREQATVYMGYLAVYMLLLARYSGRREFVVGSTAACRNQVELEGLIGLFANPILFRARIDPQTTFLQLLHTVRDLTLASFARQEYPFELVSESLHAEPARRGAPWLQAYFLYQKAFMQPQQMPGLALTPLRSISPGAMFETFLGLVERKEGVRFQLEYNTDLFDRATIARALRHLERIVGAAVENPGFVVGELDLDPPQPPAPDAMALPSATPAARPLLEEIAHAFGKRAEAVVFEHAGTRIDLATLNGLHGRFRELLASHAPAAGLRIGVPLDDPAFAVCAVLALCTEGCIAVPGAANDGIVDARFSGTLRKPELHPVSSSAGAAAGAAALVVRNRFAATAGSPENISIARLLAQSSALGSALGLATQERVVVAGSLQFLDTWEALLSVWLRGATPVFMSPGSPPPKAQVFFLPTGLAAGIARRRNAPWMEALAAARLLVTDRDPVSPHLLPVFSDAAQNKKPLVIQRWQPRETGLTAAVRNLSPTDDRAARLQVLPGWSLETVDLQELRTPCGIPGRVRVASTTSFADAASSVILTGDFARWRNDGGLEWLGHAEDLARPGFTTELRDLRDIACRHPGVWDAHAVTTATSDGGTAILLHAIPRQGSDFNAAELRRFLDERLPDYVLPTQVVLHGPEEDFSAGFDFAAWRDPRWLVAAAEDKQDHEGADPRDDTERKLAAMFGELLRLKTVDVRRGFFDLGGHSLLGVKLFAQIEKEFRQRLPLATLLSASSVRDLARRLQQSDGRPALWSSLVPMQTAGNGPRFFCVHGAGGNVLLYRDLARHMAPAVRFYGLQARGLDGESQCLTKVEDMAGAYLREILAEQPEGPYYLGGYCLGGNIAFELARLLRERGHEVRLLALLDTYNLRRSTYTGGPLARMRITAQKLGFHLDSLLRLSARQKGAYVAEKLRMARELAAGAGRAVLRNQREHHKNRSGGAEAVSFVQNANHIALRNHIPRPVACDLTLFCPRKNYYTYVAPDMGWGGLVEGRIESVVVTKNPHSMLVEPFVQTLAAELNKRIGGPAP